MLANGGGTLTASGGCVAGTAPQTTSIFSPSNANGTTNGMTAAQAAAASVAADLASLFGTAGIPSAINCASPGSSGGGGGGGATAQLASLFDPSSAALSSHLSAAAAFNPLAGMTDAATLLQLSQLFAAQQQHSIVQQLHAVQQQHQQNIQNHQHHQTQQQQQQQQQQLQQIQQQQQQSIQHTNLIPQPHQQQQPQNTPNQQQTTNDKKRSYPCTFQFCVLCQKNVHSSKLPCHIRQCHVAKPMFQCPACDFTSTYSKNNVKSHMVSLHGLAGDPISYMEQYAGQVEEFMKKCFPHVRGRGRPIHASGRLSPSSPSSPQSVDSTPQRRLNTSNSSNMINTCSSQSRQYTHSQRRMSAKQAAHISLQEQLLALAKATQFGSASENTNLSTDPSAITQCDDKTFLNNIRNLPSATVDVKRGVAIKLENTNGSNNNSTDMDTCVSSSASMVEESNRSISVANSVTPNGNCFGLTSPLNCLKNQRSLESILRLRTGENLQPRYLLHKLNWHVLDDEQISNTVFDTFNTLNTQGIMEKLDLTQFEPLVEESTFLNEEQLEKIAEVRRQINLQTFEIMYAVHRLDLGVLSAENVDLVTSIAPSAVDIHRFKNYEMSNSVSTLGENEQFVLQLSKIERMEEKLQAMSHMSKFANRVSTLNQQFSDFLNAAKLLHTSTEFHYILQILLTCGNLISGDFNAQIIKGFRTSSLVDMCSFKFPAPSELSLLNVVAECIAKHFPELEKFMEHVSVIEKAAKLNFSSLASMVRRLESGHNRVLVEFQYGGTTPMVSEFIENSEPQIVEIKDSLVVTKEQLLFTLQFFGEQVSLEDDDQFQPEQFFSKIAQFCRNLQKALIDSRSVN